VDTLLAAQPLRETLCDLLLGIARVLPMKPRNHDAMARLEEIQGLA
jgi:hypothetical protein